jgi:hypothetical protein
VARVAQSDRDGVRYEGYDLLGSDNVEGQRNSVIEGQLDLPAIMDVSREKRHLAAFDNHAP